MKKTAFSRYGYGFYILLLSVFLTNGCIAPAQRLTPADLKIIKPGATSLVVVHSRTGNTAMIGIKISELMQSDYIRLETPEGAGDNFLTSPNRFKDVRISPQKIELDKYKLIFLGSPIWYWHANAFIYTFINNNELTGKKIVLFYTYEGGISKNAIGEWSDLIKKKGGSVIDAIGVSRKDHTTAEAMKAEIATIIERKKTDWLAGK